MKSMKARIRLFLLCFLLVFAGRAAAEPMQLNITGEERFRPEMRNNQDFKDSADDQKAFIGQRIRVNFDVKTESGVKAFIAVQDSRNWGDVANNETAGNSSTSYGGTTVCTQAQVTAGTACTTTAGSTGQYATKGSDRQSLDLSQAWFMLENIGGVPIDFKIGRQQLVYGDQRLIGNSNWTDNGRSFDAYKASARFDIVQLDVFLAKLKETKGSPSDSGSDDDLYGLYSIWPFGDAHKLDVYYLVWKNDAARSVNTYGARFAGKAAGLDYTAEAVMQSGKWSATVDQSAMAFAVTGGYTFADFLGGLRIGAEYDQGSGDDKADATVHKTYAFGFGTNHAPYGYMDYFSWSNMSDIALKVKAKPGPVTTEIAYHIFALNQARDGWYSAVGNGATTTLGNTSYTAAQASSTDAGSEIDLTAMYQYNTAVKITAGYSMFTPGTAAKEHGGGTDGSTWGYGMFEFAF